jgi:hypothetical protein
MIENAPTLLKVAYGSIRGEAHEKNVDDLVSGREQSTAASGA